MEFIYWIYFPPISFRMTLVADSVINIKRTWKTSPELSKEELLGIDHNGIQLSWAYIQNYIQTNSQICPRDAQDIFFPPWEGIGEEHRKKANLWSYLMRINCKTIKMITEFAKMVLNVFQGQILPGIPAWGSQKIVRNLCWAISYELFRSLTQDVKERNLIKVISSSNIAWLLSIFITLCYHKACHCILPKKHITFLGDPIKSFPRIIWAPALYPRPNIPRHLFLNALSWTPSSTPSLNAFSPLFFFPGHFKPQNQNNQSSVNITITHPVQVMQTTLLFIIFS